MEELKAEIKQMLVERLFLDATPLEITDTAPLMETYGIDSVALFELVVGLEEEFDVHLEDTDFSIDAFHDVNAIARLVQQKTE